MDRYETALAPRFAALLGNRLAELSALLRQENPLGMDTQLPLREVGDFKDAADAQSFAAVQDVQSAHAALELEQILAARRRLQDKSYGFCLDCGDAIDLMRLIAMPAAPRCAACQTAHEHAPLAAHRG